MPKVTRTPGPGALRLDLALKELDGEVGKVGWFKTAHYPEGTPVAYVAAIQEQGYPEGNIPPRLGMAATAKRQRQEWAALAGSGAKAVLAGNATAHDVMEALGLKAAGDLRKHISEVTTPPLKADTIAARRRAMANKKVTGSLTKPLVFSGELLGSLTNVTEPKGK